MNGEIDNIMAKRKQNLHVSIADMNPQNGWGNVLDAEAGIRWWKKWKKRNHHAEELFPELLLLKFKNLSQLQRLNLQQNHGFYTFCRVKPCIRRRYCQRVTRFNRGDPGIGKSTLLLQTSAQLAMKQNKVLYISGEESTKQTKLRADRLGVKAEELYVHAETNLELILEAISSMQPDFVVIDSIQTIYHADVTSAPGSVSQVRECTAELMRVAKTNGIAIFIVGHVTKEGAIAGPRLLEHMVDTVLYFEGERHHTYRILRAVKNRFGSTNEMGILK